MSVNLFFGFSGIKAYLVQREVARSAGGIVLNKLQFLEIARYLNFHYSNPSATASP